eukprot:TRINITY_DN62069_c0_g1_i1.p1 TRINITY_DN62069_c0_g1~~TRINITY_DN62069_c0_g1_i1.p1  ORF type:complete len:772 (+),score=93.19 TRINITY_DN62069_c0_g1_i1:66-2381(+)
MIRACAVCTLICDDPLRESCEACENILPPKRISETLVDACIVASSSDSGDEQLRPRPAQIPRSEGSASSALASTQLSCAPTSTMDKEISELPPDRATIIAQHARNAQQRFLEGLGSLPRLLCLQLDGEAVTFRVVGREGDFSIILSDNYPAGNSCVYGPNDLELSCQGALDSILETVLQELVSRPPQGESTHTDGCVPEGCDQNHESVEATRMSVEKSVPEQDPPSPLSDNSAGSEFFLEDDACPWIIMEMPMETRLQVDVEHVKEFLGSQAVDCTQRLDSWRIRLKVAPPTIDVTTAAAWGLDPCKALVVEMQVPMRGYLDPACMPLKAVTSLWQEGHADFQLAKQLLQILSDFCDVALSRRTHDFHGDGGSNCSAREDSVQQEFNQKKKTLMLEAQEEPWRTQGFLVQIARYLQLRLLTVNEYCALCDGSFAVTPMFMRTVCTRELCSYQFAEFGERITTAETVNAQAEIADVLVCMFSRAVMSPRHELIVDPYPRITAGRDSKEFIFDPEHRNFQKLRGVVTELMKLRDGYTAQLGSGWTSLTKSMTNEGRTLLQWVVASNRSYLAPLQGTHLIEAFRTPFQYLLISAPPDRENQFQQLKNTYGSVFAYHGSGTENWHSILRNGLKNCSHTKYMTAGAVHGAGIYLATRSHVSLGYSMRGMYTQFPQQQSRNDKEATENHQRQAIGNRSLESLETLYMLAVCEVINSPVLKKATADIWVMPNEEMVMTRFFLVFTASNPPDDVSITTLDAQIKQCIESLKVGSTSSKH